MAKRITSLTSEQETALVEWRAKWLAAGLCCEPADFDRAEEIIAGFYAQLGKPRPMFFRFSSPMMCELGLATLKVILGSQSQLDSQLDSQLGSQLRSQLWSQLGSQLDSQLGSQLDSQLRSQLGSQLWSQLWSQLDSQLGSQLRSQLWSQLGSQLDSQFRSRQFSYNAFWGQHEAYWIAFYGFCAEIGVRYDEDGLRLLNAWGAIAESACWWAPWDGICILSDRPRHVSFDSQGRLHDETGMAVRFSCGWGVHAIHGVRVPEWVVERPAEITAAKISAETNAEIKRVMIERYGVARYVADSGARVVAQCGSDHPLLGLRGARLLEMPTDGYERPLTVVEVVNSTAEPDGSFRLYHLSVNGAHYGGRAGREVLAAVASTWRDPVDTSRLIFARPEDYCPAVES